MTERQLQQSVSDLCKWHKLYHYHTRDSRGSAAGFPDLVIAGRWVLYVELKTERGKLTIDQAAWRDALIRAGADWRLWRPADWHSGEIREVLAGLALPPRTVRGQVIKAQS
jgi:hypothetical protein